MVKQATNATGMRLKNEKIILSMIRKESVSRADIARKTGLTKAAVTGIIDDLKQRGIVSETAGKSETVGRNPMMLSLCGDALYFVGINITRFHIYIGITDLAGTVCISKVFPICNPQQAFSLITEEVKRQIAESNIPKSRIYKVAVVTPGPVDTENGTIINPPNFTSWHGVSVGKKLREMLGMETILENVSSATALSERYFGAAKDTENFLTLLVNEGIGSGIMQKDMLFCGPCELGHTSIRFDGVPCVCGNRGCLEQYASVPKILEGTEYKSWKEVVEKEDFALMDLEATYLGTAIISANNIFRFDKIVLCGDLAYRAEYLTNQIADKVEKNGMTKGKIAVCAGKADSKFLVATSVAVHDLFI